MKLKIQIDRDACLAYGDCQELAPEAFEVGDVAEVIGDAPAHKLIDAARACPSEAITLTDAETGARVYP